MNAVRMPTVSPRPAMFAQRTTTVTAGSSRIAATARGALAALLALALSGPSIAATPPENFAKHCAACHGLDRLGGTGPALLPESLERLRKPEAEKTIREGRVATQMPPFGAVLPADELAALAAWIYTPVTPAPAWTEAQIVASRIVHRAPASLQNRPVEAFGKADMMNLFLVVETGDHHVSILDGDRLERIHRFPSRYALHGGPKFTADGRYVFFASRDGWISKYDIWNMALVAEVRAGLNTRNVAVSNDGRHVAVANTLPHTIVLMDGDLNLKKVLPVRARDGAQTSRVSAVYDAAPRKSFIAALKDVPEVWEISYDEKTEDIPTGVIHDFKYKEGAFIPGYLNPRRSTLSEPLDDFYFNRDYSELMGASREAGKGQVVNLDVRKKIADLALPGMPHLGSGIAWSWKGRSVMASPNLRQGLVSVIDMQDWKLVKAIETPGPGFFLRSHENSRYAFSDSMMSKDARDTLVAIDKETLEVAAKLRPEPGKTFAHVEFTRDGSYALASLMEHDGALIVIDAKTLKEVKRLPMKKPIGKYNLWNKITRSEGTSH
jgi:mono/diheme cytochrome c family protein/DNA-binding beta-propeller fold protein YncE